MTPSLRLVVTAAVVIGGIVGIGAIPAHAFATTGTTVTTSSDTAAVDSNAAAASARAQAANGLGRAANAFEASAPSIPLDTTMPTGTVSSNGRTWVQSYAQDFNTPAALGQFTSVYPKIGVYNGQRDTSGQGLYAPDKVLSVANGNLDFYLHSENGQPLVATIMPDNYAAHTTGRVSVRFKSTVTPGYKFVGMFWPSNDVWNQGEIDWPEGDLGQTVRPASAIPGTYSNGNMQFLPATQIFSSTDQTQYHTATTEWDSNTVRFYWDGQLVSSVTGAVPTQAMRVTLQAETFINQGTVPTDSSGHLDIDWISIWN
ncbi:glycoside hydrolase family 16 protein [Frondihabitans cladoniiphilus]|uniref:GH16 domain-containing protein n=1 Tax=Frondihabitans cladoniiphilus TaxID=715785 RepID=A0ABP8VPA7_9MICO